MDNLKCVRTSAPATNPPAHDPDADGHPVAGARVEEVPSELKQILYAFDLFTHGTRMGQFLMDQLETKHVDPAWNPAEAHAVPQEPADSDAQPHLSVLVALYLSSLMEVCAEEDLARHAQWKALTHRYEIVTTQNMNTVEWRALCVTASTALIDGSHARGRSSTASATRPRTRCAWTR